MTIGTSLFILAAYFGQYFIFLIAFFVLGTGLTLLQTATNPYIVCIGPRESAAMRVSLMGIVNKGAGVYCSYFIHCVDFYWNGILY